MAEMTIDEKVMEIASGLSQTYNEALQTYGTDITITALAYVAAAAVHSIEHDPRLAKVAPLTRQSQATGVWTNALSDFLKMARDLCSGAMRPN